MANEYDDDAPLLQHSIQNEEDPNEVVMTITRADGSTLDVSRSSKSSMAEALAVNANQLPVYWRTLHSISSHCKILGADLLQCSFEYAALPQHDWNAVVPGRKQTYPHGRDPDNQECDDVRVVYMKVKTEKDDEAKTLGMSKSGVQSYVTHRQRCSAWRCWCAVYQSMNPNMAPATLKALIQSELKHCTSSNAVQDAIDLAVKRHIAKLKREAKSREKKQALQQQMNAVLEEEKKADEDLTAVEEEVQQVEVQKTQAQATVNNETTARGRSLSRTAKTKRLKELLNPIKQRELEVQQAKADAERAKQDSVLKKAAIEKEQNVIDTHLASVQQEGQDQKKKKARLDPSLTLVAPTPRQLVEMDGPDWTPPTKIGNSSNHEEPGNKWKAAAEEKVVLLLTLSDHLRTEGLMEVPLSFATVMEFLALENVDFYGRAFIHLIAIILMDYEYTFNETITALQAFISKDLDSAEALAGSTAAAIAEILTEVESASKYSTEDLAAYIREVANGVHTAETFPVTLTALEEAHVGDYVARKFMQHCLGEVDMIIGLNTRKLVCALDLYDWEEAKATTKEELKMSNVRPHFVKNSLLTWLPAGQRRRFQDSIEDLALLIGSNKQGVWGRVNKAVTKHFSPRDKPKLVEWIEEIIRFYGLTKSGGRKKIIV